MKSKQKVIMILGVLLLIVTLGTSYSLFHYVKEGTTESSIKIGDITFIYTEDKELGNGIRIEDALPTSDEDGKTLEEEGDYFDFRINSNLSRSDLEYEVVAQQVEGSTLPLDAIKLYMTDITHEKEVAIANSMNSDGSVKTLDEYLETEIENIDGKTLYQETILKNTKGYEKKFRVRMWIKEGLDWSDDKYMGKSGSIRINVYANSNRSMASTDATTPDDVRIERVMANRDTLLFKEVTVESDKYQYTLTVPYAMSTIDIHVIPTNPNATVEVSPMEGDSFDLNEGENFYKVVVTSSNGEKTKEYTLRVKRKKLDVIHFNNQTNTYTGSALPVTGATSESNTEITYSYYKETGCQTALSGGAPTNAGTYSVKVTSEGNDDYDTGSICVDYTIHKATPIITLNSTNGTVVAEKTMTFTATIKSGTIVSAGGTLGVTSGSTGVATVEPEKQTVTATSNGTESQPITVTGVSDGSSNIIVTFTPNDTTNFNSATSQIYEAKITKSATAPTATYCSTPTYNGQSQTLTKEPGDGYTFSENTGTAAGEYTVKVKLSDGYRWSDNTTDDKTITCSIAKANSDISFPTTTFTYSGQAQAPQASVKGTNGKVSYTYYTDNQCTQTTTAATINAGTYYVKATAETNENYNEVTSACTEYKINPKSVTVTWNGSTTFTYNGKEQAPEAKVTTGVDGETMTVTRTTKTDAGSYISTASCSSVTGGQATCDNYTLTEATIEFTIAKADSSITFATTTFTYSGAHHAPTAKATGTDGTISYLFYTNDTCTASVSTTVNAGTYYVKATAVTNKNYNEITSACTKYEINPKSVTVTWGTETTFTYNGTAQGPTVTTPISGVTRETLTLTRTTETNAGTHTSTASCSSVAGGQENCNNYTLAENTKEFKIEKATPTITLSASNGTVVAGKTMTFTATVKSTPNAAGILSITGGTTDVATVDPTSTQVTGTSTGNATTITVTGVKDGSSVITVNFAPTDTTNYNNAIAKTYAATITKSASIPTAASYCKTLTYNGSSQTLTNAVGDGYTFSGNTGTDAKEYTVTANLKEGYRWSDNTTGTKTFKCSIGKKAVGYTAGTSTKTYDGSALTNNECKLTSGELVSGHTVTCTITGTQTTAGSTTNTLSNVVIKSGSTDVSTNYNISKTNGKLTVNKATPVITLSPDSGTVVTGKTMTFKATVKSGTIVSAGGTLGVTSGTIGVATVDPTTKTVTATSTGEETTVTVKGVANGSSSITVNFTPTDTTNFNNATPVTYTATITPKASDVGTSLCQANLVYNGQAQTITTVTKGTGYTLSGYSQTNAGTYTVTATLASGYRWSDNTTANKTFNCSISKRDVTYKADDATKTYDGNALTKNTCTLTSGTLVSGHAATCTVSGTQKNAGSSTNTLSKVVIKSGTTDVSANYNITLQNGTLKVNKATPTITLSATSGTVVKGKTLTFNEQANVTGKFTVTSSATGTATVEQTSSNEVAANTNNAVTVTGVANGSATITVNFTPTDTTNYNNAEAKKYTATITKSATAPTTTYCSNPTYSGKSQTLTKTPGDGYTFSDNTGTEAGEYTVKVKLADGYRWSDDTTGEKTLKCTINKKDDTISITPVDKEATGSEIPANSATAESKLEVSIAYYNGNKCEGTARTTVPSDPGTYSVKATTVGNSNYKPGNICVTHTIRKNTNNYLSTLSVSGTQIQPSFNKDIFEYNLTVEASTITINATPETNLSHVGGKIGVQTLNWGTNVFIITVTSQSASVQNYKITVNNQRPTAPEITGGSESWVANAPTITIKTPGSALSELSYYEYYKSTQNTAPDDSTERSGELKSAPYSLTVNDEGITYVWYRTVSKNGFRSTWSGPQLIKLETTVTAPTLTLSPSNKTYNDITVSIDKPGTAASGIAYYEYAVGYAGQPIDYLISQGQVKQTSDGTIVIQKISNDSNYGSVYYRTVSTIGNTSAWVSSSYNIDDTSIYVNKVTGTSTTSASSRTLTLTLSSCGVTGYSELCYYVSSSQNPSSVDVSKPTKCISISNGSPQVTITESGKYVFFAVTNGARKRILSPTAYNLYVGTY